MKWPSNQEVAKAVAIRSPAVIGAVVEQVQRDLDGEAARHGRIEDKAKSLLTVAGASISIVLTFGAKALMDQSGDALRKSHPNIYGSVVLLGFGALFCAMIASWLAARALRTADTYVTVSPRVTLDADAIKAAVASGDDEEQAETLRLAYFQRHMLPKMTEVLQERFRNNETKASTVKDGQWFFAAFLTCLVVIAAVLACGFVLSPS